MEKEKEGLAFNDVSMIRSSPSIAKIKIKINNKTRIDEFLGDGCLISTAAGSSAYNLSLKRTCNTSWCSSFSLNTN